MPLETGTTYSIQTLNGMSSPVRRSTSITKSHPIYCRSGVFSCYQQPPERLLLLPDAAITVPNNFRCNAVICFLTASS